MVVWVSQDTFYNPQAAGHAHRPRRRSLSRFREHVRRFPFQLVDFSNFNKVGCCHEIPHLKTTEEQDYAPPSDRRKVEGGVLCATELSASPSSFKCFGIIRGLDLYRGCLPPSVSFSGRKLRRGRSGWHLDGAACLKCRRAASWSKPLETSPLELRLLFFCVVFTWFFFFFFFCFLFFLFVFVFFFFFFFVFFLFSPLLDFFSSPPPASRGFRPRGCYPVRHNSRITAWTPIFFFRCSFRK